MKSRTKEFAQHKSVSFRENDLKKIDAIQNNYLIDRSNIVRVLLHNLTVESFGKLLKKQIAEEKKKRLVKRKIATTNRKK